LEEERHKLIERAMKTIPNYHPPSDYRRPTKTQEKVYVPVNDYPEINFSMIANPQFLTSNLCPSYHSLDELHDGSVVATQLPTNRVLNLLYFTETNT
jgi:hypothetical protein